MADTRKQILLTIKEQAQLLREPVEPLGNGAIQHRWSAQQWWEAFTFLFVNHLTAAHHQHQDDLLFFVRHKHQTASSPQVFVRRKGKQLPEDLQLTGRDFGNVDWAQTVLLNLVLHSQYQLTVVACGPEALPFVAEGRTWSPGMISVTRPVYASTTVTAVNLDSSRAQDSNPQPCYPDICFAVDNFDNTFEDLVLEDVSRCYCVVLHAILDTHETTADQTDVTELAAQLSNQARLYQDSSSSCTTSQQQQQQQDAPPQHDGSATSTTTHQQQPHPSSTAPARTSSTDGSSSGAWQIGTQKRTLFAGYVSFQQILDFMESNSRNGRSLLDSWLKGPKAAQKDKVVMTGPGGMGRCEVAVTKMERPAPSSSSSGTASSLSAQQQQQQRPSPPAANRSLQSAGEQLGQAVGLSEQQQQRQGLLQRGLQRARVVASGVQQALDVLSELQPSGCDVNMLCALMTLRLPAHYLAQELLAAV